MFDKECRLNLTFKPTFSKKKQIEQQSHMLINLKHTLSKALSRRKGTMIKKIYYEYLHVGY